MVMHSLTTRWMFGSYTYEKILVTWSYASNILCTPIASFHVALVIPLYAHSSYSLF